MKQYNYLQAIYMSFYSRSLYRDVAKNWGGGVVLYLLLLLFISWLLIMVRIHPTIVSFATEFGNDIVMQLPEMKIDKGILSTPENKPYLIQDKDKGEAILVIDTSGEYQDLDNTDKKVLLIKKDSLILKSRNGEKREYSYPSNLNVTLTPEVVKEKMIHYSKWLWVGLFPLLLLFSFCYRLIQSVVYAILGKLYSLIAGIQIEFPVLIKLAMIAITPVLIVNTILDLMGVGFRFESLFYFILAMVYLVFAINSNRNQAEV